MHEYVEGLGNIRLPHVLAFDNRFICFRTANHVVGLDCKDLLEYVRSTECFDRPYFHFSETLTPELSFTTQRLLSNERVRSDRTCVHLIVDKVTELQHVCHTNRHGLIEAGTGETIIQVCTTELRKSCLFQFRLYIVEVCTIEDWSCIFSAELLASPCQHCFVDLAQVHTRRHTERVETDIQWSSVFEERHVFFTHDPCNHTFVTVASGHLITNFQFTFLSNINFRELNDTCREFITDFKSETFTLEFTCNDIPLVEVVLHDIADEVV